MARDRSGRPVMVELRLGRHGGAVRGMADTLSLTLKTGLRAGARPTHVPALHAGPTTDLTDARQRAVRYGAPCYARGGGSMTSAVPVRRHCDCQRPGTASCVRRPALMCCYAVSRRLGVLPSAAGIARYRFGAGQVISACSFTCRRPSTLVIAPDE